MEAETCTNCEEPIAQATVYFDGRPYCCVGCVAGGPCLCTYEAPTPQPAARPAATPAPAMASRAASSPHDPRGLTRPTAAPGAPNQSTPAVPPSARPTQPQERPQPQSQPAPRVAERPNAPAADLGRGQHEAPRTPIPFRRPGGITVVVHLVGFPEQREALTVAGVMEQSPHFKDVSLTRVGEEEA